MQLQHLDINLLLYCNGQGNIAHPDISNTNATNSNLVFMSRTTVAIIINNAVVTADTLGKCIHIHMTGCPLRTYLLKKSNWTAEITPMALIDDRLEYS